MSSVYTILKLYFLIIIIWNLISFIYRKHSQPFCFIFISRWYKLAFIWILWNISLFGRQNYKGFISVKGSKSFMINFTHDFRSSCILNPFTGHYIPFILSLLSIKWYCFIKIFHTLSSCLPNSSPTPIVCKTLLLEHLFFGQSPAGKQSCPPTKILWKHLL